MATRAGRWPAKGLAWAGLLALLLAVAPAFAADVANDECLACHSDKSLTTKRAARTVSLFVDGKKFSASVHNALSCTSCHADLAGKDLPHTTPLARVECGTCHSDEQKQHSHSLHGKEIGRAHV